MKFAFAIPTCLLLFISTGAVAAAPQIHVLGVGNSSCGTWLSDRKSGTVGLWTGDMEWVLGFLTAINAVGAAPSGDIAGGADVAGLAAWVDNYCTSNPLNDMYDATAALEHELGAKK